MRGFVARDPEREILLQSTKIESKSRALGGITTEALEEV
jgi:hypothetical protein